LQFAIRCTKKPVQIPPTILSVIHHNKQRNYFIMLLLSYAPFKLRSDKDSHKV